jgi:hypothetical protein
MWGPRLWWNEELEDGLRQQRPIKVVILASTHGRGDYSDFTLEVMEAINKMKFISIIITNKRKESSNVTYSNTISLKYHNVRHKVECIWHIDLKEYPI